jgi:hypothetical protein
VDRGERSRRRAPREAAAERLGWDGFVVRGGGPWILGLMTRWALAIALLFGLAEPTRACSGPPPRAEQLRWHGDALYALVAPEARLIVFDAQGARVRTDADWADGRESALPTASDAWFVLREDYDEQSGACFPMRIELQRSADGIAAPQRVARLAVAHYVTSLRASPSGTLVAVGLQHGWEDLPERVAVFDVARGAVMVELETSAFAWIDDQHALIQRDGAARVLRLGQGAPVEIGEPRRGNAAFVRSERGVLLFEGGRSPRLVEIAIANGAVEWRTRPTVLRRAPSSVSLQGGRAVYLGQYEVLVRAIDDGRVIGRVTGRPFYNRASLSDDGARLALISHARVAIESDGDSRSDGAPRVEVVELATGAIRAWGDGATESRFSAP